MKTNLAKNLANFSPNLANFSVKIGKPLTNVPIPFFVSA